MTQIVISELGMENVKRKVRIQILELGTEKGKSKKGKNITLYDDLDVIDIDEMYDYIIKAIKIYVKFKEKETDKRDKGNDSNIR